MNQQNNNTNQINNSNNLNTKILEEIANDKLLDEKTIADLGNIIKTSNAPIISILINKKTMPAIILTKITGKYYGLKTIEFNELDVNQLPSKHTNINLLDKYNAVPILFKQGSLYIAINDPNDYTSLTTYQFNMGVNTQAVLMSLDDIQKIKILIKNQLTNQDLNTFDLDSSLLQKKADYDLDNQNNNPIVEYVDKIINEAIKSDTSDIHFEPYKKELRIRFRNDGMLLEIAKLPIEIANKLNSRLKIIANLDISEKRMPQDGRFNLIFDKQSYDFRISTCPTLFGEKIVIRILNPAKAKLGIDELGYEPDQKKLFLKALHKLQGIILVTGPTGSGKTISLYTAINILNTDDRNISTAEDPIEIYLPGINQVQVNNKIGLSFASALRCFLRQDPDIMMVGEIRDLETAEIAIKAAQTGHLVLSTLHTNGAAETLNRLVNMGLPVYNLATSISMIIAQRLIRKLCDKCKIVEKLSNEILLNEYFPKDLINNNTVIYTNNPDGCDHCTHGYKGRIGLYETMAISKEMEQIILNNGSAIDIKKQAQKENILSLRQAGLRKVAKGITSLTEVNRVTKDA